MARIMFVLAMIETSIFISSVIHNGMPVKKKVKHLQIIFPKVTYIKKETHLCFHESELKDLFTNEEE